MKEAYPHQIEGGHFLAHRRVACLWDDAGSGKTLSTVIGCDILRAMNILVVCPASVRSHWANEFTSEQRVPRPVTVIKGLARAVPTMGVNICSHDALTREPSATNLAWPWWDVIILDEGHEFRTYTTKRVIAMFGDMHFSLWKRTHYFWNLSATPIVNSAADLFPFLSSTLAATLRWKPTYEEYIARYTTVKYSQWSPAPIPEGIQNEQELWAAIRPFVLRRTEAQLALNLPELRIVTYPLAIDDQALFEAQAELRNMPIDAYQALLAAEQEPEAISRVRHAMGLIKAPAIAAYMEQLLAEKQWPLVGFYIHRDVGQIIANHLRKVTTVDILDGETSHDAENFVRRFQNGETGVALVQVRSGGTGLTLTRGRRAVVIETPWTDVALKQCIKRLHRIGQAHSVLAEVVHAAGNWFDTLVAAGTARKAAAAQLLLGD